MSPPVEDKPMKYQVFQIDRKIAPDLARDAFFYKKDGKIFNQAQVRGGLDNGSYKHVANVDAVSLEAVFEATNVPGYEAQIERLRPAHSLSVGDVVVDANGRTFVVASFGFDEIEGATTNA
jgi:hypothetical protein